MTDINNTELLSFIERIENVEEREKEAKDDKKEIYSELKATGYDPKPIKKIIKIRKADRDKLREENEIYDTYAAAIGLDI